MLHSLTGMHGMITAPHHLAAQAGLAVLRDGGNAIEATVAVAATMAVVYPHMTGIGGDGFWLIAEPDGRTHAIDACGAAARRADPALYHGHDAIPWRGPLAANTVAGTVSGWAAALARSDGTLPLGRLLRDAIVYGPILDAGEAVPAGAVDDADVAASLRELTPANSSSASSCPVPRRRRLSGSSSCRSASTAISRRCAARSPLPSWTAS